MIGFGCGLSVLAKIVQVSFSIKPNIGSGGAGFSHTKKARLRISAIVRGCVLLIGSTYGCGRSNSGSNPGILPNIEIK